MFGTSSTSPLKEIDFEQPPFGESALSSKTGRRRRVETPLVAAGRGRRWIGREGWGDGDDRRTLNGAFCCGVAAVGSGDEVLKWGEEGERWKGEVDCWDGASTAE